MHIANTSLYLDKPLPNGDKYIFLGVRNIFEQCKKHVPYCNTCVANVLQLLNECVLPEESNPITDHSISVQVPRIFPVNNLLQGLLTIMFHILLPLNMFFV